MRLLRFSRALIICAALMTLAGCNDRPSYVPSNNEMAELLYDIHIMESCFRCNYVSDIRQKAYLYHSILKEHDMTPGRFDSCITWYCYNRKQYKDVYNIIEYRLAKDKRSIIEGRYRMTEDFPGAYFYFTNGVIPKDIAALQKIGPLRGLDGRMYKPVPSDSIYIGYIEIPEVPYREGFSPKDSTAELSTNNSSSHTYIERF